MNYKSDVVHFNTLSQNVLKNPRNSHDIKFLVQDSGDHSGRAVLSMNRLRPLEHWDRWFESHSRHGCLFAFIMCLFR
jgi:hypothetical protein